MGDNVKKSASVNTVMPDKPKISFVIPVYNGTPFMAGTLDTLLDQTLKEFEIIVIDDGSTDNLYELMKYYTNIDRRIRYFRFETNEGAAKRRNYGNKQASADIICVADAGDLYPIGKARVVYNYFKKHPDVGVFTTGVDCVNELGRHLYFQIYRPFNVMPGGKPSISHPATAYRKWIALKWPYRETSKATDNYEAFFLTLVKNGIKFGATPKVYLRKLTVPHYKHYRDLEEARRVKVQTYQEFKIPIPPQFKSYQVKK